jgi:hypothetical protein
LKNEKVKLSEEEGRYDEKDGFLFWQYLWHLLFPRAPRV